MEGYLDGREYLFHAPVTHRGADMLRDAVACSSDRGYCDITILEDEILFSGLSTGTCCLAMESIPDGTKLNEAIYTYSRTKLLNGLAAFKSHLEKLDISLNNLTLNNIIIDGSDKWHSINNYYIENGFGNDKADFMSVEKSINSLGLPDTPTAKSLEQLRLHSIITDGDGNVIYPIIEACRRFASPKGVGFKDKHNNVIIPDDYLWASDFSCNRAVVQLKNKKMGIINRKGRYIIPPIYSNIVYNPDDGISIVRDGDLQTRFDYQGNQLEEWHK